MVTEQEDKDQEEQKVQAALQVCGYPKHAKWTFKKVKDQMSKPKAKTVTEKKDNQSKSKGMVVLPYVHGVTEKNIADSETIQHCLRYETTLHPSLITGSS